MNSCTASPAAAPLSASATDPSVWPLQVDDVEAQLADLDGVAVGEDPVGLDRQRCGVESMRSGRRTGRLRDLGQRQPVIAVLVAGDDQRQLGGVTAR